MGRKRKVPVGLKSAAEIEEMYGLTRWMLTQWVKDGEITAYKFGPQTTRYDPKEIVGMCEVLKGGVRQ